MAGGLVLVEERMQSLSCSRVVDDPRDLEVVLQATEVHVGRADSRYLIVNEKELGVEEAVGVLVDLPLPRGVV